ncbi:hypothetical protein N8525_03230 [Verrucomicrobiales bacterium]|nr:hypothetical protein [Verrucomicrobiales bacterium]MDF1785584.1 hypothetical protein [Verrucomicrobiales bacterium]
MLRRRSMTISVTALGAGIAPHYVERSPLDCPIHSIKQLYQRLRRRPLPNLYYDHDIDQIHHGGGTYFRRSRTSAVLAMGKCEARLGLSWEQGAHGTYEDSHVSVTAKAGDRVSAEGKGTQFTKIDLQLLERELKKLPFPDREIRK